MKYTGLYRFLDADYLHVYGSKFTKNKTYCNVSHRIILQSIGCNDDVDILNNSLEDLVQRFCLKLQCQQSQVHLVHEKNRLDSLSNSLSQHGLCLHTYTFEIFIKVIIITRKFLKSKASC